MGEEHHSAVAKFEIGAGARGIKGVIDNFDFLHPLIFVLVEVGVGGIDDQPECAGFVDAARCVEELG